MSEREFHPAANIFPMDQENIGQLAEDIRKNGQQVPIEIMDGKILDGRRRWVACGIAGVAPVTREVDPSDPVVYVLSLNLHRRHLNPSQLSMVAARARDYYDEQAKERQKARKGKQPGATPENLPDLHTDARDAAGKAVGVSGRSVDFATKVLKQGIPELVEAVDEAKMAVSTAAVIATEPPDVQRKTVEEGFQGSKGRTYKRKPKEDPETEEELPEGESRGIGIQRAHEAIACLKRIPKNDALRKRGFQVVTDWIKHNK